MVLTLLGPNACEVPMTILLLGLFACGVSLLTLFSGFGLGTLLMPAFALFLPLDLAVGCTAVVHFSNNLFKVGLLRGHVRGDVVLRFGLPAIATSFLGAWVLVSLAPGKPFFEWTLGGREAQVTATGIVLGGVVFFFALFELMPNLRRLRAPPRFLPVGGALSGFFGGLSGHQGALRAAFLGPLNLQPAEFAGTQALIALCVDAARLLIYGWTYMLLKDAAHARALPWNLIVVATLSAFLGAYVGKKLLGKMTLKGLHLVVGWLLVLVGAGIASGLA